MAMRPIGRCTEKCRNVHANDCKVFLTQLVWGIVTNGIFYIRYRSLINAACRKSTRMIDLGANWQGPPGEYGGKAALTA